MIAASGILVIIAFITLIVGVFQAGLGLIWASIAASVLAAVFLGLGVVQTNKRRVAPAGAGRTQMPAWSDQAATTAVLEREDEERPDEEPAIVAVPEAEPEMAAGIEEEAPETEGFEPPAPAKPARARTATSRAKAASSKPSTKAASGSVVVIPDRDKFHRDSCRYAKNPAAMTLTKAAARRQGYKPCATCKP